MIRTPEEIKLDSTRLNFGKHKGLTPDEIAENDKNYIVWGYINITNRPFCSLPLAVSCGYRDMSRVKGDVPLHDRSQGLRENPYRIKDDSKFNEDYLDEDSTNYQ